MAVIRRSIGAGIPGPGPVLMPDMSAAIGRGLQRTGSMLASGARGTANMTASLGRGLQNAAQATATKASPTLRFMAGLRPGDKVGPKAVGSFLVSPNYPGLDRPIGESKSPFKRFDRPYDRTRQIGASFLRRTGPVLGAASAAGGVYQTMYNYPMQILSEIDPYWRITHFPEEAASPVRGVRGLVNATKATLGINNDPISQAVGHGIRRYAFPAIRHDLYRARQQSPALFNTLDLMRSTTPMGVAQTIGLRLLGSEKQPEVSAKELGGIVGRGLLTQGPASLKQSPYYPTVAAILGSRPAPEEISYSNLTKQPEERRTFPLARAVYQRTVSPVAEAENIIPEPIYKPTRKRYYKTIRRLSEMQPAIDEKLR